ncbi:MAG TPA: hypothetical protein PLU39_19365, partial [Armatimonadota bacterium]|nr:hypothetical protein [Armatimonadota bacterium]
MKWRISLVTRPGAYHMDGSLACGYIKAMAQCLPVQSPDQPKSTLRFRYKESEASEVARNPARGDRSPRCLRAKP